MQPRKRLRIEFNGVDIVPYQFANAGTVDAQNGPKPQFCNLSMLTNNLFIMDYSIEFVFVENQEFNEALGNGYRVKSGANVLFNRWTETVDIDSKNYSRITRSGKFMIRSDNVNGKMADEIRQQMCAIRVPNGFLRENASYTIDPSGLGIQYRITDQEVYRRPPAPAHKARGTYIESAPRQGPQRQIEVRLTMEGDRITDQDQLLSEAIRIGRRKLNQRGRALAGVGENGPFNAILKSAVVQCDIFENKVEVLMRATVNTNAGRSQRGVAWDLRSMTDFSVMGITRNGQKPPYPIRGSAGIILEAARYYDPAITNTVVGPVPGGRDNLSRGVDIGKAGVVVES